MNCGRRRLACAPTYDVEAGVMPRVAWTWRIGERLEKMAKGSDLPVRALENERSDRIFGEFGPLRHCGMYLFVRVPQGLTRR